MAYVEEMDKQGDLLVMMNKSICTNKVAGLYDGCKKAIELAESLLPDSRVETTRAIGSPSVRARGRRSPARV